MSALDLDAIEKAARAATPRFAMIQDVYSLIEPATVLAMCAELKAARAVVEASSTHWLDCPDAAVECALAAYNAATREVER